jgi:hypothetical protein
VTSFLALKLLIEQLIATAKDILGRYSNLYLYEVIISAQYQALRLERKPFRAGLSFVGEKKSSWMGIGCSKSNSLSPSIWGARGAVLQIANRPEQCRPNLARLTPISRLLDRVICSSSLCPSYYGNVSGIVRR